MSGPQGHKFTAKLGNDEITFETGRLAQQAGGAVVVRMGESVLLVDADIRRPAISQMFRVDHRLGLTDVLAHGVDLGRALMKTDVPRLRLLPVGTQQESLSELLGSNQAQELVREIENRYDDRIVVFDSSPLLGASEAAVLASLVGQIAVVVEAGKTPKEVLVEALTALNASEDQMLGLIYNKNRARKNARYYSGYHTHG